MRKNVASESPTQNETKHYYYRPLKALNGAVLKCAGHGAQTPEHRAFYETYFNECKDSDGKYFMPGVVILEGYRGDRIQNINGEWVAFEETKFVSALDYVKQIQSGKTPEQAFSDSKALGKAGAK